MQDAQAKVATLQANNQADAVTLAAVVADLTSTVGSTGDQTLAAIVPVVTTAGLVQVFGAQALQTALEAQGFTVTAPVAATATDTTTTPTV